MTSVFITIHSNSFGALEVTEWRRGAQPKDKRRAGQSVGALSFWRNHWRKVKARNLRCRKLKSYGYCCLSVKKKGCKERSFLVEGERHTTRYKFAKFICCVFGFYLRRYFLPIFHPPGHHGASPHIRLVDETRSLLFWRNRWGKARVRVRN